jgi:steroid delta-isomerase-like uncharacterized protein
MNTRETVERSFQAYGRHDLEALLALLDDDVVIRFPTSPLPIRGKEAIRPFWSMAFTTLIPDVRQHDVSMVAQGGTAACRFIETGTVTITSGTAASLGVPEGGRPYRIGMATFFHISGGGLIDEIHSYWDAASFSEQLGIDLKTIRSLLASPSNTPRQQ